MKKNWEIIDLTDITNYLHAQVDSLSFNIHHYSTDELIARINMIRGMIELSNNIDLISSEYSAELSHHLAEIIILHIKENLTNDKV